MMNRRRSRLSLFTGYLASSIDTGAGSADCDEETTGAVSRTFISRLSAMLETDAGMLNDAWRPAKKVA